MKKDNNFLKKKYNFDERSFTVSKKSSLDSEKSLSKDTEYLRVLEDGIKQQKRGNYEKALKKYEKYINYNRHNSVCNTNLASLYLHFKNHKKAEQIFIDEIERKSQIINIYTNYSNLLINQKRYKEALEICTMGINIDKNSKNLIYNLSLSNYLLGNFENTYTNIKNALNINPNDIELTFLGINTCYKLNKETEGKENINNLFSAQKNNYEFIEKLVLRSKTLGNIRLAIDILDFLIQREQDNIDYLSLIIYLHGEQNNFAEIDKILVKVKVEKIRNFKFFVNLANTYHRRGDLRAAIKFTKKALDIKPNSSVANLNLGAFYKELGYTDEAEKFTLKSITLDKNNYTAILNLSGIYKDKNENYKALELVKKYLNYNSKSPHAYLNEANIYQSLGDFNKAENALINCINLDQKAFRALFLLTIQKRSSKSKIFEELICNTEIESISSDIEKIDILYAKANISHDRKQFKDASYFLNKANKIKRKIYGSDKTQCLKNAQILTEEELNLKNKITKVSKFKLENLFIVGMPRCGSTLLESILCTNNDIDGLGETLNVEKFHNEIKTNKNLKYNQFISRNQKDNNIKIDKQLYNYLYSGFILRNIKGSKIIHIIRNPLDNILSIYRAHFLSGNRYSTSINECLEIYLSHLNTILFFKNFYKDHIKTISYKELVTNPEDCLKDLLNWLDLDWNNSYLNHHNHNRAINTASRVQARSPINSKSINSWENYKEIFNSDVLNSEAYKSVLKIIEKENFNI